MTSDVPPYGTYPPPPPVRPSRPRWLLPALVLGLVAAVTAVAVGAFLLWPEEDQGPGGPAVLRRPVQLLPVVAAETAPCKAGWTADPAGGECLRLGSGMSVGRVSDLRVQGPDKGSGRTGFSLALSLYKEDAEDFADMTREAAGRQTPADRIAIVADGRLLSAPAVATPITGGDVEISGPPDTFTRQYVEDLARRITGG